MAHGDDAADGGCAGALRGLIRRPLRAFAGAGFVAFFRLLLGRAQRRLDVAGIDLGDDRAGDVGGLAAVDAEAQGTEQRPRLLMS